MFEKLANVFRIPDLRKRIMFTLGLLAVYRLGGHIPTPGINADLLQQFFEQNRKIVMGFGVLRPFADRLPIMIGRRIHLAAPFQQHCQIIVGLRVVRAKA